MITNEAVERMKNAVLSEKKIYSYDYETKFIVVMSNNAL